MAELKITITEEDVKKYIADILEQRYNIELDPKEVYLEVKTKQNYKAEWEFGQLRFIVNRKI